MNDEVQPAAGPSDLRLRVQARLRQKAISDAAERRFFGVALISLFIPFGFLLAVWPLTTGRGRAWKLALFSIVINPLVWIGALMAASFRLPNC